MNMEASSSSIRSKDLLQMAMFHLNDEVPVAKSIVVMELSLLLHNHLLTMTTSWIEVEVDISQIESSESWYQICNLC